ncbi:hypothetical protein F3Y22_tig00111053pilonHSYRG00050 [Hibiscus syriacus]|uniref:Uncharacterized protein n=1 Tax=Hibiscus syriacus TaxID=106335 RepID=A0A6A2Z676_HIBSY|nr:hypothetical protein F3Y22_tig00111053pilonHSYRG00050 [Hibiscus syriacus]
MASFCKPQQLVAMLLLLFIFTTCSLSSARLLDDLLSNGLPATEPTLDLALAAVEDHKTDAVSYKSEQPCDHRMKRSDVAILRSPTQRLAAKYGPMILSRLPKVTPVPPSAPSKGINNINN